MSATERRIAGLHVELHGPEGAEAILLSAGLGGAAGFWQPQLAALAERHRVILYDQRGTGRSPGPLPEPYSIGAMAEDVLAILDGLGLARCHLLGHALGGLVGLELALRAPHRLGRLALVNAWAGPDPHTQRCFEVRLELLRHGGPAAYTRAQPVFLYPAAWLSRHAERAEREVEHGIRHFQGEDTLLRRIGALRAFDAQDRLGQVALPVLCLAARDDVLVPWTCSEALAAGLPDARAVVLPEGGHACTATEPAACNAAILAFLAGG